MGHRTPPTDKNHDLEFQLLVYVQIAVESALMMFGNCDAQHSRTAVVRGVASGRAMYRIDHQRV